MTAKDFVKSKYPNAFCYRQAGVYRIKSESTYLAHKATESKAWTAAKREIIEREDETK